MSKHALLVSVAFSLMVLCLASSLHSEAVDPQKEYRKELIDALTPNCGFSLWEGMPEKWRILYGIDESQYKRDLLDILWSTNYPTSIRKDAVCAYSGVASYEEIAEQLLYALPEDSRVRQSCAVSPLSNIPKFENRLDFARKTLWFQVTNEVAQFDMLMPMSYWVGQFRGHHLSELEQNQVLEMYRNCLSAHSIFAVYVADRFLTECDPAYAKSPLRRDAILNWISQTNSVPAKKQAYYAKYFLEAYETVKDVPDPPKEVHEDDL